jgi:hypothetical protein
LGLKVFEFFEREGFKVHSEFPNQETGIISDRIVSL